MPNLSKSNQQMFKRAVRAARAFAPSRFLRGSKYVGAGALIFDPDGRVLMIRSRLRGTWEYPAGGADGPESPLETCRREVAEEVGLNVNSFDLLGVDFWHRLSPNGNLLFTFSASVSAKQAASVKIQAYEVIEYRWASRQEAMKLVPDRLKSRLSKLLDAYDAKAPVYLQTGQPVV